MKNNTKIYDRFTGYTTKDCACEYCLYYQGKDKPCKLDTCCCAEEREQALLAESVQAK